MQVNVKMKNNDDGNLEIISSLTQIKQNFFYKSPGDKFFSLGCYVFLILVCLISLFPVIYVLSASLSSAGSVMRNEVVLLPQEITWRAYQVVIHYKGIWTAYANTIFYTVTGTAISVVLTALAAYPLSRKRWKARKILSFFVTFTMWFSGGMIPFYLLIRGLGLYDTRLGILLYPAIAAFYVIIMRTYFESLPDEIEEQAKIDGANDLRILFQIIIPLSLPTIAAIALYYGISRWNSFFWEMLLLSDEKKLPVQVLLQRIILAGQFSQDIEKSLTRGEASIPITIKYACIIVTALPIIMIYPFIQKYFVKGVLIGGIKG
jgi:ABC-type sugar transport system, permease component